MAVVNVRTGGLQRPDKFRVDSSPEWDNLLSARITTLVQDGRVPTPSWSEDPGVQTTPGGRPQYLQKHLPGSCAHPAATAMMCHRNC